MKIVNNLSVSFYLRRIIMCKQVIYLTCLAMVFGLAVSNTAVSQEAGLVGWWKFDETSGTNALDSSGNGNNGAFNGGIVRAAGRLGGAIDLDGTSGYVNCGNAAIFDITEQITLATWIRSDAVGNNQHQHFVGKGNNAYVIKQNSWNNLEMVIYIGGWKVATTPLGAAFNSVWHHVAGTYDGSQIKVYIDGELIASTNQTGSININGDAVMIGTRDGTRWYFDGLVDDVRIYNIALSDIEIKKIASPETASAPSPADGSIINQTDVTLMWDAGINATQHDVYFSNDMQAVTDGTAPVATVSQTSYGPLSLDLGISYYWRVDEVQADGSVHAGDVWSFTIQPIKAYNPNPADGAKYVDTDVTLSWSNGFGAISHDVYFGTDAIAVADADNSSPEFISNQDSLTYQSPTLQFDTTYYWRIDELKEDATITRGDVWTFRTIPELSVTDETLVGWWKLDDNEGSMALDWSGRNNHGNITGNPQWTIGQLGNALELDGYDDAVDVGNPESFNITDTISLLVWIKPEAFGNGADQTYIAKGNDSYALRHNNANNLEFRISDTINVLYLPGSSLNSEWHHLAGTYDGAQLKMYLDGVLGATANSPGPVNESVYNVNIGRESVGNRFHYNGAIDEVRIYNRALTEDEIIEAMREDLLIAWIPNPTNGAVMDIKHIQSLTWLPGDAAVEHDVYFGTDRDTVAGADISTPEIYKGRRATTSYTPTGLQWDQSYFWRIDEINNDGTVSKGKIWSFTIADYLVVDDFEDYNDYPPNEIWNTWIDGYGDATNGSTSGYPDPDFNAGEHYLETTIVHSGVQSFPLFYDNAAGISEATKTLSTLNDWTEYDVNTLTLWYYGNSDNAAVPMYVVLNGSAASTNDNVNAARALEWTQWDIPLQVFADQGVNLANVGSITLGFGNRSNPTAGGAGNVFFDDIRLYRLE